MIDEKGLSASEARSLFAKFGPNKLPEKPPPSSLEVFLEQLKSPLVYILIFAAVVTALLREYSDTIIITVAILINTILGFLQEKKASNALEALKQLIHPTAHVIREGKTVEINVEELVPGDIVILNQGDKVPADGLIIDSSRLFVMEAILTGESAPIPKEKAAEVFMGTVVTAGRGFMKVVKTGGTTAIGKIALSVQEADEDTPMKKQLTAFSKELTILTLTLTGIVFVVGLFRGFSLVEIFLTAVSLAVSAIPEGLLVALTVVLAIGMQRILKRKGLVRHLVSAETLGGVTTICSDKTGTLTEGKMKVVQVLGNENDIVLQSIVANDMDDAVVIAAMEYATPQAGGQAQDLIKKYARLDSIPFSSKERFFACLNEYNSKKNMLFVNGAPEFLLEWSDLKKAEKEKITKEIAELTEKGMRIIGMARREMPASYKQIKDADVKRDLTWIGAIAFFDPVRAGVKEALEKTNRAGIKLIVITGDYAQTAVYAMKNLGLDIDHSEIVLGDELEKMSEAELEKRLAANSIKLFARTAPDQKLKIVGALKKNGEVVAMMGDGVNDAPALAKSDIGVVVAEGTDVAKESADLILLDSSFETIVHAIEEGRSIFDNIRKIILYLMSDAFSAIITVILTIILGLPLPVTAAQILWINLVSDGFPNLALTVDPKRPNIMEETPRDPREKLVASWMRVLIAIVSTFGGVSALLLFWYTLNNYDLKVAQSVAFAALGINSLVYVFSMRTLTSPFWKESFFDNKWLLLAVAGGSFIFVLPYIFSPLTRFFDIVPLHIDQWLEILAIGLGTFILIELSKVVFRKQLSVKGGAVNA